CPGPRPARRRQGVLHRPARPRPTGGRRGHGRVGGAMKAGRRRLHPARPVSLSPVARRSPLGPSPPDSPAGFPIRVSGEKNTEMEPRNRELCTQRRELCSRRRELCTRNREPGARNRELETRNRELETKSTGDLAKSRELEIKS